MENLDSLNKVSLLLYGIWQQVKRETDVVYSYSYQSQPTQSLKGKLRNGRQNNYSFIVKQRDKAELKLDFGMTPVKPICLWFMVALQIINVKPS